MKPGKRPGQKILDTMGNDENRESAKLQDNTYRIFKVFLSNPTFENKVVQLANLLQVLIYTVSLGKKGALIDLFSMRHSEKYGHAMSWCGHICSTDNSS